MFHINVYEVISSLLCNLNVTFVTVSYWVLSGFNAFFLNIILGTQKNKKNNKHKKT